MAGTGIALWAALAVTQQTSPASTLETFLKAQFMDVANECARIDSFRTRQRRDVSPIPSGLRTGLSGELSATYQELQGRTLTDLYGAIWEQVSTPAQREFGAYRRVQGSNLGLRFSQSDDRVIYGEADSARHTHNCSTVVSLALQAGAAMPLDAVKAALSASHDDTSKLAVSMVSGTFRSPIWTAVTTDTGRGSPTRGDRFAT